MFELLLVLIFVLTVAPVTAVVALAYYFGKYVGQQIDKDEEVTHEQCRDRLWTKGDQETTNESK